MITLTLEQFKSVLKDQGLPIEQVKFICPRCKTIQCAQDFIACGIGETIDEVEKYVAFSCIGRFSKDVGCDWTLGGLFQIHELEVLTADGELHPRFRPANLKDDK